MNNIKSSALIFACFCVGIQSSFAIINQESTGLNISTLTKEQTALFEKLSPEQKNKILQPQSKEIDEGTVECLNYFGFNDVSVEVTPVTQMISPGKALTFSGKVINPFSYPLVDGQVYAKIFIKNKKNDKDLHLNGYRLIDQFVAVDGIAVKANGVKPVTFTWNVPASATPGEYGVSFYYASAHRFNLTGLTFTNDITGNKTTFSITSSSTEEHAYFNEDDVFLNDKHFYFAQSIPIFKKDENVVAHLKLVNPTNKEKNVIISQKLYTWDSLLPSNLKDEKSEVVTLAPNEVRPYDITFTPTTYPASYAVVTALDDDNKSILNLRFGRSDIFEARNNRMGMITYPLLKNATSTLTACAHLVGPSDRKDSTITVLIKDLKGKLLHTYSYTKGITPYVLGFKDDFSTKEDVYDFTMTSIIQQAGVTTEEITLTYSCKDIDPSICPKEESNAPSSSKTGAIALIIFGIVGIGGFFVLLKRIKKEVSLQIDDSK